ncbi:MAG: tRNA threonylcarbamoyladenosine biosynthesis protein TsaB [Bacteroidales bacterium]|nr:tRNA threonylcarbamoyladenosine biosynthesis protein TsaB [Bacteroidales bacterium]
MNHILCLETSTDICSVALFNEGNLVSFRETKEKNAHSARLTVMIDELMQEAGLDYKGLSAVAISKGPGSYTGLRIGAGVAKGLCYATQIPLIAVSTLESIAYEVAHQIEGMEWEKTPVIVPMIDARRMEVYKAIYDACGQQLKDVEAEIIHENSFQSFDCPIILAGDGAAKCRPLFYDNPQIIFMDNILASARWMGPIAQRKLAEGEIENTAYFEPFYLKDFIAGIPKVKGLK